MATLSDVVVNSHIVKLANATRRITGTVEELTVPEIIEKLEKESITDTEELANPITPGTVLGGKTGFVNGEKIEGTMPVYEGSVEIEPGIEEQELATSGKFLLNNIIAKPVTSAIDENIVSENIKKDITILGVTGKNTVVDTEENASPMIASDVLKDKVGFVNGSKVVGTLDIDNINVFLEFLQGNVSELEDDEILQILQGNYIYIEG